MSKILITLFCFISFLQADHFITFIIPCYNCDPWIEEAIDSIYKQILKYPFELICTDDGSTDRTLELLTSIQRKHPEMTVLRHEQNRGGGAARNTCVRAGKGDLIFCLDSDNVLVPNSVQTLIDRHDETGFDVVTFGGLKYFAGRFDDSRGAVTYDRPGEEYTFLDIVQDDQTPAWSGNYLYTRKSFEATGGYSEETSADTFSFGFRQLLQGCRLTYVPRTYYWHRIDNNGYYSREGATKRIAITFFQFLLQYKHLFADNSVKLIEKHLRLALQKREFNDQIWFLHSKVIRLKE